MLGGGMNPQPTAQKAYMLATNPSWHNQGMPNITFIYNIFRHISF